MQNRYKEVDNTFVDKQYDGSYHGLFWIAFIMYGGWKLIALILIGIVVIF